MFINYFENIFCICLKNMYNIFIILVIFNKIGTAMITFEFKREMHQST